MGPLNSDCVSDTKTRFVKNSSQSFAYVEAICPQPHRAVSFPYFIEDLSRFSPVPKSTLARSRDKTGLEIIGVVLNKEDTEAGGEIAESSDTGYLCGSPPARTHNPVIHDAQFTKHMNPIASCPPVTTNSSPRAERGSPKCNPTISGSPKIRVEGFNCGKSDPLCVVPTLA
ncbi:uncharacterized protein LOC110025361 [Phalaenopsis equestris]|uniref:uncharacterized protein LOC110025361 n=1 Tax=Phalaenopsis equestris TaxID=78828 RepID=UPI0009E3DC2E|nr:uncharacterized protein LOC110025361 [Phalaenopsis equestris]